MRAAVLRAAGEPLRVEDVEADALRDDEVLVAIAGTGICHTDLVAMAGHVRLPLPVVLGHEGAGTVVACGAGVGRAASVGDQVVLTFDHCRSCPACAAGTPGYCGSFAQRNNSGTRLDGTTTLRFAADGAPLHGSFLAQSSFATHAVATVRNAVRVQTSAPLEACGPLGCSLLTGAGAVLSALRAQPGDGLAVFGLGSVGLAAVMAGVAAGCDPVVAVDRLPARLALAGELGATVAVDVSDVAPEEVARTVRRATGGGVALSVDAVGAAPVVRAALEVLRSPGRCATTGFAGPLNEVAINQGHLLFGRHLLGVIEGDADPHALVPELLALHARGAFPLERLVTTFPLEDVGAAIAAMRAGDVVKPVLVPS